MKTVDEKGAFQHYLMMEKELLKDKGMDLTTEGKQRINKNKYIPLIYRCMA